MGGEKRRIGRNGSPLDGCLSSDHLVPGQKAILHESTVIHGTEAMPFGPKVIQYRPKCGEKPLSLSRRCGTAAWFALVAWSADASVPLGCLSPCVGDAPHLP